MSFELKCPECGNDGSDSDNRLVHMEYMPTFHFVAAVQGKTVFLDYDNYMDDASSSKEAKLCCFKCSHEWDVPDGVGFEDLRQFEGTMLDGNKNV